MSLVDRIHGDKVHGRRVRVLCHHILDLLPVSSCSVLDVGCGDGRLAALLQSSRAGLEVSGLDVLVRPDARIPVTAFDGKTIPLADRSIDVVMLVDVLHHTQRPLELLREAARVCRHAVLLKDHVRDRALAGPVLRFMDYVGNSRHGVALPYNYQSSDQWKHLFQEAGLEVNQRRVHLGIYPRWADWLFGADLHLIASLVPTSVPAPSP